jgi:hypothetical protein
MERVAERLLIGIREFRPKPLRPIQVVVELA